MRRFVLVAILALLALPVLADSQAVFETITVATSGIGITSTTYQPTTGGPNKTACVLTLETAQIRWRSDGVSPTSSVGHIMDTGGVLVLTDASQMAAIRFIRTGGSSGVLSVTCF